jgi:hypothetical protein
MILLKWILNKYTGRMWSGFIWFKIGSVYKNVYELSDILKCCDWAEEI